MKINEAVQQVVAIYPGRFHPFHKGHASVYNYLRKKFDTVFIATSDKVDPPRSPFNFAEKREMMIAAGIPPSAIVQTKNPYQAQEILQAYDPATTAVVFAVSEKDMAEDPRFSFANKKDGSPSYFQPMAPNAKQMQSFDKHGYITTVPTLEFNVVGEPMRSATELRRNFANADTETQKTMVNDLYGAYNDRVYQILSNKLAESLMLEDYAKLTSVINRIWQLDLERPLNEEVKRKVLANIKLATEAWSEKYKRSINCNNPKGFSQRAHCQGRNKKESVEETISQKELDLRHLHPSLRPMVRTALIKFPMADSELAAVVQMLKQEFERNQQQEKDLKRLDKENDIQDVELDKTDSRIDRLEKTNESGKYNPDGKTYRGAKNRMPVLDPNDPVHNAERFDLKQDTLYDPAVDYDRSELKSVMAQKLKTLSDIEQAIIKAKYWDDMSLSDIATKFGLTKEQVYARLVKALRKMKHPDRSRDLSPFINEALDNPYPLTWRTSDPGEIEARARTKNVELNIYFSNVASDDDNPVIDISFLTRKPGASGYGTMLATGQGDEFRVFATVKKAIEDWWNQRKNIYNKDIHEIKFQAAKDYESVNDQTDAKRRDILYTRLAKEFATRSGYHLSIQKLQYGVNFKLTNDEKHKQQQFYKRMAQPIEEAFDSPYPMEWQVEAPNEHSAWAKIPFKGGDFSWLNVDFDQPTQGNFAIEFTLGGRTKASGKGDEFRIFATVIEAIKQWWKKIDQRFVDSIYFSASKDPNDSERRHVLYSRFAKQFASQIGYKLDVTDKGRSVSFLLTAPKRTYQVKEESGPEVTMWTNPDWFGADVDTDYWNKQPVKLINIDKLVPYEPEDKMQDGASAANMQAIAKSISAGKKINPIVISKHEGKWLILDGHHRYFASKLAGAKKVRVVVVDPKYLTWRDDVPDDDYYNEVSENRYSDLELAIMEGGHSLEEGVGRDVANWAKRQYRKVVPFTQGDKEEMITRIAKEKGVDPRLMLAMADKESSYDTSAIGDQGKSHGLFQLQNVAVQDINDWYKTDYTDSDRMDPETNARMAAMYFNLQKEKYGAKNDVEALANYNGGPKGTTKRNAINYARDVVSRMQRNKQLIVREAGVGKITKQNATKDAPIGSEFANVKKLGLGSGKPPELHKKARKNSDPNTLFNIGLAEEDPGISNPMQKLADIDQAERREYQNFVKTKAGGDWDKGAKQYAALKKRSPDDIFGEKERQKEFRSLPHNFNTFKGKDWDNYWILSQHADDDVEFQKKALANIEKHQGKDHDNYKYLHDRISVNTNQPQKYGTQNTPDKQISTENVKENSAKGSYLLQLERDDDLLVLHITHSRTGKRTEVRGKPDYEGDGYDPNDPLHQLLDKIGKAASISDLMNGELVSINPVHPQGPSAKAHAEKAFVSEDFAQDLETEFPGLDLDLYRTRSGYILSKIVLPVGERNEGTGSKVMQRIVDMADQEGKLIALTPDTAFGGTKSRLIKFYKRFGFVPNKGRNKTFDFREIMVRYPQSQQLSESKEKDVIIHFVQFCKDQLKLPTVPKIIIKDKIDDTTFGQYNTLKKDISIRTGDRHIMDVLRTLAHELVHHGQRLITPDLDGSDGSAHENQANAIAGVLLRKYGENNPKLYEHLEERASIGVPLSSGLTVTIAPHRALKIKKSTPGRHSYGNPKPKRKNSK